MVSTAPDRTTYQRLEALQRANEVRSYRSRLKGKMKRRERGLAEVLTADDPDLRTMRVFEVVLAAPKIGRVKANRALARARVSPSKTIGGLTARQRDDLLAELGLGRRPGGALSR